MSRLPRSRDAPSDLRLVYLDGHGILREALAECARRGFSISDLSIKHTGALESGGYEAAVVTVELEVRGRGPLAELATELNEMRGIVDVHAGDVNAISY